VQDQGDVSHVLDPHDADEVPGVVLASSKPGALLYLRPSLGMVGSFHRSGGRTPFGGGVDDLVVLSTITDIMKATSLRAGRGFLAFLGGLGVRTR
jgi:hypothetical protein